MQAFSIKDRESLSGIKAHAWRIWEHWYGLGISGRRDVKHMPSVHINDDLKNSYLLINCIIEGIKYLNWQDCSKEN